MAPLAAETPHPSDSASTHSDERLLAFLRQKPAGEALPAAAAAAAHFHDADIYATDPATLTLGFDPAPGKKSDEGGSWFFFTHVKPKSRKDPRKWRMVDGGAGTWHSERAPRAVCDAEGSCVGYRQYFCYKRTTGKNCRERTDWYMVEFTEGQEGDHERVHGGEPMMVLCKIYRAHSGSRSSSSSLRSARKRKPTDEQMHVDQFSAPTKPKHRLFAPAPSLVAASQEQVSSIVTIAGSPGEATKSELEASNGNIYCTSDDLTLLAKQMVNKTSSTSPSQNKTNTATPSQTNVSTESDFLTFWCDPEAYVNVLSEIEELLELIATALIPLVLEPEVSTLQRVPGMSDWGRGTEALHKIHSTSDCRKFSSETQALHETSSTPPNLSMFEPEGLQGETTLFDWGAEALQMINRISDYLKFSSETGALHKTSTSTSSQSMFEPKVSELQGETTTFNWGTKALQNIDGTSDYLEFSSETEALQKRSTTPSQSMFEPEASLLQDETSTFDWGIQMPASCTSPASAYYYRTTDPMAYGVSPQLPLWGQDGWSWTGNDNNTTASFCRDQGWFVGGPPTYDLWGY